ncbi:hypothetical protein CJD36_018685 [Flavipsychrobacter stenotrophus]|uniref:Uncharacterized protein n=1 Tax=Flavipsychrobacter stenotrophus TaxID=2077091 RepID=A0A2S7SRP1_9BACT|nr:hypothetical protein [Flavipsychrobacter stenotrophus]PQJ09277.1 hypothetical protein CJD36_018685 [Flavipsychrobacter stenotrophus]
MNIDTTELAGIAGAILMALYTAVSFPAVVKNANAGGRTRRSRIAFLLLGVLSYGLLGAYALLRHYHLVAFVQVLGALKYTAVFIQLLLGRTDKMNKGAS